MSATVIVVFLCVGVVLETAGILLGVREIKANRRAALALSRSVSNVYLAGSASILGITGSAELTAVPKREPSRAEQDRRRLDDHEAQIAALRRELAASEERVEGLWKRDLRAVADVNSRTTEDLRAATRTFGAQMAAGRGRRYFAIDSLIVGAWLQAVAAVAGTL